MALADWASVIVAAGLLAVTAVYTFFTAVQLKPYLKASIIYDGSDQIYFIIQNTGKGAAHNVTANWEVEALETDTRNWSIPLIQPGERHRFSIPLGEETERYIRVSEIRAELGDNIGRIQFCAKCKDVVSRTHRFHEYVSIKEALNRIDSGGELPERDALREISDAIEQI